MPCVKEAPPLRMLGSKPLINENPGHRAGFFVPVDRHPVSTLSH